ncbi:MAG: hypothetical protein M0036_21465 [Desulfobacteraceae bacterium]|nr:hypothetical protein [Desulfobacteraceae bacterium]
MSKVQTQIKSLAKNLASLAGKLEKLSTQVGAATKAAGGKKKRVAKAGKKAKAATKKKGAAKKAPTSGKDTVLDNVMDVIVKSRAGANIASLREKTGLESRQLSNALYKLSKKGQIKTVSRGVYVKA